MIKNVLGTSLFVAQIFKAKKTFLGRFVIPVIGVEPILHRWNGILNPARLPIPPHRHNIK
ncbi:hypothetical protein FC12_GL001181 [Lacticaseibacillus paracasei subsp. tolerans DSM 20258]|nr:hypothetical protein FC12_GL001181 [Lacticaseibacillus paracasei subsp. tolerans DSM 20258]